MVDFIANRIKDQAAISIEAGQEKYCAYFVKTKLYMKYKPAVDEILTAAELTEVIVTE